MLYLPILVQNMAPKHAKGWRGIKEEHAWDGQTYCWGKIVPKLDWVVKEVRGREGGTPVEHTYQLKNMYICAPLYSLVFCRFQPKWNSHLAKNNSTTTQMYIGTTTETTTPS